MKNFFIRNCHVGISLNQATNCIIANNTITGTSELIPQQVTAGIYVWEGNHSVITGNRLADNYNGIYICYDSENTIVGNSITNSASTAILFWNTSQNTFYHNSFNNKVQVFTNEPSVNVWSSGEKGNYWSGYNGHDSNGDGIGDTPYAIDGNQQDDYPSMIPFAAVVDSGLINSLIALANHQQTESSPTAHVTPVPSEPQSTGEPLSVLPIVAVVALVVVAGVVVYLKKRK